MNREEIVNNIGYQLTHAAMAYYRENCTKDISMDEVFEDGAEWMREKMIDKACEWLKQQVYQEYGGGPLERLVPDERIEAFRKEMEE